MNHPDDGDRVRVSAKLLGITHGTADRLWAMARAWLLRRVSNM